MPALERFSCWAGARAVPLVSRRRAASRRRGACELEGLINQLLSSVERIAVAKPAKNLHQAEYQAVVFRCSSVGQRHANPCVANMI